jgi:undecaprenyl-diphosphatase
MPIEQIVLLAIVQGLTEFLPVSSSGHLILLPVFTGWADQGLVTDVMVHIGSLFAVIVYFWRDVLRIITGTFELLRDQKSENSRLALCIAVGTIPAILFGLVLKTYGLTALLRNVELIAWNAIIFGVLMLLADRYGRQEKNIADFGVKQAIIVGLAQALALIPGTSRSGITMTAARYMGFERTEAARFSFLLGIPAIAAAGGLTTLELVQSGEGIPLDALYAAALTFISALIAITFLMRLVGRIGLTPFAIYRFVLAAVLFAYVYGWLPGISS